MQNLSLPNRVSRFNQLFPKALPLVCMAKYNSDADKFVPFIQGCWFLGGGNHSSFYGAYNSVYLDRITSLFKDAERVVHLFAGSLPHSKDYLRVGLDPTKQYKYDIEMDAEHLSSSIKIRNFQPDIIYADPPYSIEDSREYGNDTSEALHYQGEHFLNRPKVVSECARVLAPGGFLIWLDQVLPVFTNTEIQLVGLISYIRSTGNRFRCVSIFQKALK